jgi:hypothetical protein
LVVSSLTWQIAAASSGAKHTRRFSMYTSKDIAEALEKIPADDLDATAIA